MKTKLFQSGDLTLPPSCIYEILIQIFTKILRQNQNATTQRKSSPEPPKIQMFNNIDAMNSYNMRVFEIWLVWNP